MKFGRLIAAVAAIASMGVGAAQAASGYATANVNMRAGPDTEFPSVNVIPEGSALFIQGCLRDESWCDVRWGADRGWVYSEYLAFNYRGQMTPLPDVGLAVLSLPVVTFAAASYWNRNYVGRPWYNDRQRWVAFRPRPREGWRAPPPGPRHAGWWRSGYRAPTGMGPPPDRGWKRPSPGRGPGGPGPGPGPGPRPGGPGGYGPGGPGGPGSGR
jgi:uncharacterized protein YraI